VNVPIYENRQSLNISIPQNLPHMKFRYNLHKLIAYIAAMCVSLNLMAQVDPGEDFDLNGYINQKLDEGETHIVVPPGRYRVPEVDNYHLFFNERADITIVADSVEMICTETVPAIRIRNCQNLTIKGLSIDYDPLPFTQGEIVALSDDKRTLTIDLINGYSSAVIGSRVEIYDKDSEELVTPTYYGISYTVDEESRRVILTKPSNYSLNGSKEEVGDIAVFDSKSSKNIPHAIVPTNSTGLVLENITLYSGPAFGFFETRCSSSTYINCKIDRRPLENEIRERALKRMRSNNLDGFHSKYAEVGPSYIGCVARYQGDDGIAINGDAHIVTVTDGNRLTVVPKGGKAINIFAGDSVELVSYRGKRLPNAYVVDVALGPAPSSEAKTFLRDQNFFGNLSNMYTASNVYYITLDREVYLPMGSLIASTNRVGNGFEIRDCIMGPNRSRGILVKAGDGIISGNTLKDNWGQAIKLAPEYGWLEAGTCNNVTVENNVISGCRDVAIAVYAFAGNGAVAPIGMHDNVQIRGNSISGSTNPAIAVTSTSNLLLENNTIESPNNDLLLPWMTGRFGRSADPDREIYVNNFELVSVAGVTIDNCIDTLLIGDTYNLDRTISPANAAEQTTRWRSSDTELATVDNRGIVTALSAGTVTLTVISNDEGLSDSCTIHMVEEPVVLYISEAHESQGHIYPNPSKGVIHFEGFQVGEEVRVYSITGYLFESFIFNRTKSIAIPKGLYFVKTATNTRFKLVVN